jgi:transposase-like protein
MLQVENDQDTAALVYNYSVEVCTPENPYTSKRAVVRNVIWQHQEANPIGDQIDCHDDYSYQRWRCSTCGKTWKQIIS